MTLSELLRDDLILLKADCVSKENLIEILLDRVYGTGQALPLPQKDTLEVIRLREQIGGTLLPSGLAVPHARIEGFEGFVLAVGVPAEPLFHEGLQIRLMAMMITSLSGGPYYLGALAALAKLSRDGEYFSRLSAAPTPAAFLDILKERDLNLD